MIRTLWPSLSGAGAALLWTLFCLLWFDDGSPYRPAWLAHFPPLLLAAAALLLMVLWLHGRREDMTGTTAPGPRGGLLFVVALAFFFRLPLAVQGAAGYVTPDGALSGIVALHLREGIDHLVFVPHVPYSGSLKSHLAALLSLAIDTPRAFALASVLFYALFVAALYRLACMLDRSTPFTGLAAGLYAAFSPAFVTRYSLSNDGNYVEVLALGSWALVVAVSLVRREGKEFGAALALGLLLGAAFWCHILAAIHAVAVGLFLLVTDSRRSLRSLPAASLGFGLGYLPGLLWNVRHGWESFRYLLPGGEGLSVEGGVGSRTLQMILGQWPVLVGYDSGYPPLWDAALKILAWLAVAAMAWAVVHAVRHGGWACDVRRILLILLGTNLVVALLALPALPGNARYLLFLMTPLPILLADVLKDRFRWVMAGLVVFGFAGSLAQAPGTIRADGRWREFAAALESQGVRWCFTDFYLATKVNFLTEERVACSAKLGPTMTEYFFEYRERVEKAPEAALIAVNASHAEKLERRLERLGVTYERLDLMKPVLLRLSRKVDPEELFPGQAFPIR